VREALTGRPAPGVLPLAHAAACDVAFALGVLRAPSSPEEAWSPWFGLPAYVLALTLPLLLFVLVVVALTGPPVAGRPAERRLSRWQAATIAMAGLGFATYLSPWGRTGVAAVLET
jgi:hypothetical protein